MIALIPARGGSKGLPGKNIKLLNGKPLIAHTIDAALKSKNISRVLVSTDCAKIAKIAKEYGAEVPFLRPDVLATDEAKSLDVYKYTFTRIEKEEEIKVDNFVILQPTSPLRTEMHIDEAINLFKKNEADSVISFCKEDHSVFWHKFIDEQGKIENIFEGDFNKNRQEIKTTYYPNGAIYAFNKAVLNTGKYYTQKTYAYIMGREFSVDIDDIMDWYIAEAMLRVIIEQNNYKNI